MASYNLQQREHPFIVVNPVEQSLFLYQFSIVTTTSNSITIKAQLNKAFTIYFAIVSENSDPITYEQIKQKIYPYDYFGGDVILGEYIQYDAENIYQFEVTGIPTFKNFQLYAFFEDLQGNLCSKTIVQAFNTKQTSETPTQGYIYINGDANIDSIETNTIISDLAGLAGINVNRFISSSDSSYPNFVLPNSIVLPTLTGGSWFEFIIVADLISSSPVSTNQAMLNIQSGLGSLVSVINYDKATGLKFGYRQISLQWMSQPKAFSHNPNEVEIDNLSLSSKGKVVVVIINQKKIRFSSTQSAYANSIRYLRQLYITNNIDLSTQQVSSAAIVQKSPVCTATALNDVSIICDGTLVSPPDYTRIDQIYLGNTNSKPNANQIKNMLDSNNYKPDAYGYKTISASSSKYGIWINGLQPNTQYKAYLIGVKQLQNYNYIMSDSDIIELTFQTPLTAFTPIQANALNLFSLQIWVLILMFTTIYYIN